jgi:hypothetical protein
VFTGTNFILDFNGNGVWDGRAGGDVNFRFNAPGTLPVVGDWDGDGTDNVGKYFNRRFYLDFDGDGRWDGPAGGDVRYVFPIHARPVTGKWEPPTSGALMAAGGHAARQTLPTNPAPLTAEQLSPLVEHVVQAASQWPSSAAQASALERLDIRIADLPGSMLGRANGSRITLDVDAAGHGWFVDATPWDDAEFTATRYSGDLTAYHGDAASKRFDLLTAVFHELGHVLGQTHEEDGVMQEALGLGTRRSGAFNPTLVDHVFAD